jgi:Zn-dependent metalloprotease
MRSRFNLIALASIFVLIVSAFSTSAGRGQTPPTPDGLIQTTLDEAMQQVSPGSPQDWQIYYHAATGKVRFLGTRSGAAIPQPAPLAAGATAETAARSFLAAQGELFGLKDAENQLELMRQQSTEDGRSFVRFQQVQQGLPVLAGELVVQLDPALNVISVSGEISPFDEPTLYNTAIFVPRVDADAAQRTAIEAIAKAYALPGEELQASTPELWIYNPALLDAQQEQENRLVWRIEVTAPERGDIRELVLVDASTGYVALHFSQIDTARSRLIYNNQNNASYGLPGNGPVRIEGGAATGNLEVDNAYDYLGFTYDYYNTNFGRDGIDGVGMPLVATVLYCPSSTSCPFANAFWNGTQMVFGQGFAAADDIVAHELTHGVTEHESHLYYYMQSGAINEALSDIFGEFVDLSYTNGRDNDSAEVAWLHGEDLVGGANRSMKDPTLYGDPDRMGSPNYYCGSNDSGGVHTNSGVANKAAFLMTAGETFNGYTVSGIGIPKSARIWYETQRYLLTSGSDYQDLGVLLSQACTSLIGTASITSADCNAVREAVAATEMNLQPGSCTAYDTPMCALVGIDSSFNGTAPGWYSAAGAWYVNDEVLYTTGAGAGTSATAFYNQTFQDIDYQVSLRRYGDSGAIHGVVVRGEPLPLGDMNLWHSGYGFFINRNGYFDVLRFDDGHYTTLQPWTIHEAINTGDAWNTLRVMAQGPRLDFYVNDRLIWSGSDATHRSGNAGVLMYNSNATGNRLEVDWAALYHGTPQYLFYDDFENPVSARWGLGAISGTNTWYYPQSNNPFGRDTTYGSLGYNLWGYANVGPSDYYAQMNAGVSLPASSSVFMYFRQSYTFEQNYDGGVLEYTTGGGWTDAAGLFDAGSYNGAIDPGSSNPLAGRSAFTGNSNGLRSSRLNLSDLAGQTARFRFRIGTDHSIDNYGWCIDDVRIYTCQAQTAPPVFLPLTMRSATSAAIPMHFSFNGASSGWPVVAGTWLTDGSHQYSNGQAGAFVSIHHPQNFSDVSLTLRVLRSGCHTCAVNLIVRGVPTPLGNQNRWYSYISFQISNDGQYSVYKRVRGGSATALQPWTSSSAIHQSGAYGDEWNVLRVIDFGDSLFFYINGQLVWSGSDATLTSGEVGFSMYSDSSPWNLAQVDWATIDWANAATTFGAISPEQQALNDAAWQQAARSETGAP